MRILQQAIRHFSPHLLAVNPAPEQMVNYLAEPWQRNLPLLFSTFTINGTISIAAFGKEVIMSNVIVINITILAVIC